MPSKPTTPERRALLRRSAAARRYIKQERPPLEERYALLLAVVCPRDDRLIAWSKHIDTEGGRSSGYRRQEDRQGEADSVPS